MQIRNAKPLLADHCARSYETSDPSTPNQGGVLLDGKIIMAALNVAGHCEIQKWRRCGSENTGPAWRHSPLSWPLPPLAGTLYLVQQGSSFLCSAGTVNKVGRLPLGIFAMYVHPGTHLRPHAILVLFASIHV